MVPTLLLTATARKSGISAPHRKTPLKSFDLRGVLFESLAVTYSSMATGHTTIGAERFHFRVRNGIGWFPLAIAARQTVLRSMYRSVLRDRLTVLESIEFFVPTLSRSKWNEFHPIH